MGLLDASLLSSVSPSGTSVGDLESNSSVDFLKPIVGTSQSDSEGVSLLDSLGSSVASVLPSGGSNVNPDVSLE